MKGILLGTLSVLVGGSSIVKDQYCQFVPKNDRYIPVATKANEATGISEETFNSIMDRIEKIYAPIIESKGGKLDLRRLWTDGTVNASAERIGDTYRVNMYGGMARHELITADGFMLVACHEVGHHLGGKPKYSNWWPIGSESWASVEGQSDYFGTAKCMRKMFLDMSEEELLAFEKNNAFAEKKCNEVYSEEKDQTMCVRNAIAGVVLGDVLGSLSESEPVNLETPSVDEFAGVNQKHPKAQCRADTYFQGALCSIGHDVEFSNDNQLTGACVAESGFENGMRPKCWFNPKKKATRRPVLSKKDSAHNQSVFY